MTTEYEVVMYEGDYPIGDQPFWGQRFRLKDAFGVANRYEVEFERWLNESDLHYIAIESKEKNIDPSENIVLCITRDEWYIGKMANDIANRIAGAE